ncbi:MAG TPA: nitroreductase family protein [Bacillota bacterium]|nr:nitroreductase family protein [Bacillota bacterium]HOL08929.1 nitroreductase family protein [Bacillota bacterium]HPO96517.1 nitroreductase family protein [Bacillota bacterium]
MKNKVYIKTELNPEEINNLPEKVLLAQIRLFAHQLDQQLQLFHLWKNINFQEAQLTKLSTRLAVYSEKYGDQKPVIQWAKKIEQLFLKAINNSPRFNYPWSDKQKINISKDDFERLMTQRRSIRCFNNETISDYILKEIIKYGTWAPSTCNLQALRYIIIKDPQIKNQINSDNLTGAMGYCIVAIVADFRLYDDGKIDIPIHDAAAAAQNILLASHYYNVGACYVSDPEVNSAQIRKLLNIAEYEKIAALIWMGRYEKLPLPPARNNVDEVVEFI